MSIPNKDVKQTNNNAEIKDSVELNETKQAVSSEQKSEIKQTATKEPIGKNTVSSNQNSNKKNKKMNAQHTFNKNDVKKDEVKKEEPSKVSKDQEKIKEPKVEEKTTKQKTGKGIALLALLIALGVGGAGYYFGMQKFNYLDARINSVEKSAGSVSITNASISMKDVEQKLDVLKASFEEKLTALAQVKETTSNSSDSTSSNSASLNSENIQALQVKLAQLEEQQKLYSQKIASLGSQLETVKETGSPDTSLSVAIADTNFVLKNAQHKLSLDGDVETVKNLLKDADKSLIQIQNPKVVEIKQAIQEDLKQLSQIKEVDQDALMLQLTALADSIDDMPLANLKGMEQEESTEVSDSINDWETNLKNSTVSFLNHFIRISDEDAVNKKVFIAPTQEAYLRENIRLRLQIATLAIPRQQDELYKTSLKTVGNWVRSYFDMDNNNVKAFLIQLDKLTQQSLYIDAPHQLKSLDLLKTLQVSSKQADTQ